MNRPRSRIQQDATNAGGSNSSATLQHTSACKHTTNKTYIYSSDLCPQFFFSNTYGQVNQKRCRLTIKPLHNPRRFYKFVMQFNLQMTTKISKYHYCVCKSISNATLPQPLTSPISSAKFKSDEEMTSFGRNNKQ